MSLAIIGGTVVDLIITGLSRLPIWPSHTEFKPENLVLLRAPPIMTLGGNGANAAYAAARCGAAVTLHTQLGDDPLGRLARGWLEDAGCRIRATHRMVATAINVTAANLRHQRATLFYPGRRQELPLRLGGARHALVCGWPHPPPQELEQALCAWRRRGVFTALDVGPILNAPMTLPVLRTVLASLDLLIANEYELRAIAATPRLTAALARVRDAFAGDVVVKCGARGACWLPAGERKAQFFAASSVRVLNTVGAGDCFNGALLAALATGLPFPAAMRRACATAATAVSSPRGVLGVRAARIPSP